MVKKQGANAACRYGRHAHIAARRVFFGNKQLAQTVIHITFLLSAMAIAYTDKLMSGGHSGHHGGH